MFQIWLLVFASVCDCILDFDDNFWSCLSCFMCLWSLKSLSTHKSHDIFHVLHFFGRLMSNNKSTSPQKCLVETNLHCVVVNWSQVMNLSLFSCMFGCKQQLVEGLSWMTGAVSEWWWWRREVSEPRSHWWTLTGGSWWLEETDRLLTAHVEHVWLWLPVLISDTVDRLNAY